jgi:small subunit ribosomal protein S23
MHHSLPLSQAYRTACQQYVALRSERTIASRIAFLEAQAYGAKFSAYSSEVQRGYKIEEQALAKWGQNVDEARDQQVARKKWRPVFEKSVNDIGHWTMGEEYVHKYKQGERPSYAAVGLDSLETALPREDAAKDRIRMDGPDLLNLRRLDNTSS